MDFKTNNFYLQKDEPIKSCLLALRDIILNYNNDIIETYKYGMPCFCYKGKQFCYLWTDKKTKLPYILIVEGRKIDHPKLISGSRSRMKIFLVDPNKDIPLKTIHKIFDMAVKFINKKCRVIFSGIFY